MWLVSTGERIEIARYRAAPVELDWEKVGIDVNFGKVGDDTRESFVKDVIVDEIGEEAYARIKEQGIPLERWDNYRKLYPVNFKYLGDAKVFQICYWSYNGEFRFIDYRRTDAVSVQNQKRTHHPVPSRLKLKWTKSSGERRGVYIDLDEKEMLETFAALADEKREEQLTFHFTFNPIDNSVHVSLRNEARYERDEKDVIHTIELKHAKPGNGWKYK